MIIGCRVAARSSAYALAGRMSLHDRIVEVRPVDGIDYSSFDLLSIFMGTYNLMPNKRKLVVDDLLSLRDVPAVGDFRFEVTNTSDVDRAFEVDVVFSDEVASTSDTTPSSLVSYLRCCECGSVWQAWSDGTRSVVPGTTCSPCCDNSAGHMEDYPVTSDGVAALLAAVQRGAREADDEAERLHKEVEAAKAAHKYEQRQLHQECDASGIAPSQSLLKRVRALRTRVATAESGSGVADLTAALLASQRDVAFLRSTLAEGAAPPGSCRRPPPGWYCTLNAGHEGPCPTVPDGAAVRDDAPPPLPYDAAAGYRRRRLPDERRGHSIKFKVGRQKGYASTGLFEDGTLGEVFIRMAKPPRIKGDDARCPHCRRSLAGWIDQALGDTWSMLSGFADVAAIEASMLLQAGVPLRAVARKLTWMRFAPSGRTNHPRIKTATSVVDFISKWLLEKYDPQVAVELSPDPVADSAADPVSGKVR